jgi:hypothetical protein
MPAATETERLLRLLAMLSERHTVASRKQRADEFARGVMFGVSLAIGELRAICNARLRRGSARPRRRKP